MNRIETSLPWSATASRACHGADKGNAGISACGLLGIFTSIGMEWYDILPYKKNEEDMNGIKALLDHVGRFIIVIYRTDAGKVGISVAAQKTMATPIMVLDGMEVVVRDPFDFENYKKYRRYKHKRHCAIPISARDSDLESLYRILDREVEGQAFLAVNVKKTASMSRIYSYIRCMENGQSPGAMSAVMSMVSAPSKTTSISAMRQNRIQNAKSKIAQSTHLFSCEIICGGMGKADLQAMEAVFPFDAFKGDGINAKKTKKTHGRQSVTADVWRFHTPAALGDRVAVFPWLPVRRGHAEDKPKTRQDHVIYQRQPACRHGQHYQ